MMKYIFFIILSILLIIFWGCGLEQDQKIEVSVPVIDTGVDEKLWVLIPAGKFYKGQHNYETEIDYDYEIMLTDVTNAQYANYLNEALARSMIKLTDSTVIGYYPGETFYGYKHEFEIKAGDWLHFSFREAGSHITFGDQKFTVNKGYANHPVVMITWFGAKSYGNFYGWRLPTENEWEKAARGTDKRVYPWGDELLRNQANFYSSHDLFQKIFGSFNGTTPVGYYNGESYDGYQTIAGKSPYGLYDMAGNVWQWTGDDYPYMHLRYMRGGSFANYEYNLRVWARNSAGPDYYGINVGFRCVRNVVVRKEKSDLPDKEIPKKDKR